ncbi:DUF6233 domain-containing protein [Streptomyces sp. AM 4-1-1]|uniref:DUF6233 domain-containing protein n=1 Tax=Streptomyces sp. AM 4-1-1 TaxID=3028710 RepID=UPI0023B9551D|nr:DUF6233 domain-containing protein [Streptomyces sp. AM 4-1-1]WEH37257.1 DUF6233 domain-containing protein [Streptomyces sp. AM 4-1-1]
MSDPAAVSRLDKLRALEEWLSWQLTHTRNKIREAEVQERQEQRARERARAEQVWKIQPMRTRSTALLHRGGCSLYPNEFGYSSREEAIIALAEPNIGLCEVCPRRPGRDRSVRAALRGEVLAGGSD